MKLEKREITLNEKDSVTDMLYMEKMILESYETCEKQTEIKEIKGLCKEKAEETRTEIQAWEKSIEKICFAPEKGIIKEKTRQSGTEKEVFSAVFYLTK